MSKLVIVESPTKIKKIQQYLPKGYVVDSCVGHIRDLPSRKSDLPEAVKDKPWADYAVNIDEGFQPIYVTIRGKGKVIQQLKRKLKEADELLLATDEDREGESISWHLIEALKPKVPVRRMVFHEITKKAIEQSLANPRELDMNLVQAQETRRVLDRLFGYALSPLLWKKVGANLSAGRVQSSALRIIVQRERERRAFQSTGYWSLTADLEHGAPFTARLTAVDGAPVVTSNSFDRTTGQFKGNGVLLTEAEATTLAGELKAAGWRVVDKEEKPDPSRPQPPFITSTLQQAANNRLGLGARDTMRVAQRLYENGFITYMRTDSTNLSDEAIEGARQAAAAAFGAATVADAPRHYKSKKAKGAQEAHEAIRPSGEEFVHPDNADLSGQEMDLYRMIWQRTLACQMKDEEATATRVDLEAGRASFRATGKVVTFPGYRLAWPVTKDDDTTLPGMEEGDTPTCRDVGCKEHRTTPRPRYTEASIVQTLEAEGIGRPSTYASILDVLLRRNYVAPKGRQLVPSFTGFAVTTLLERQFPNLVDTKFTANMEEILDEIAAGEAEVEPFLTKFFLGPEGLQARVAERMESMDPAEARVIDLGTPTPFTVKIGRFGPYVEMEHEGEMMSASIPEDVTPDEFDEGTARRLIAQKAEGPKSLGTNDSGTPVFVLEGRYGPYYQLGEAEGKEKPPRASLPKGKGVADASLEEALFLLSLPLTLGAHPEGGDVVAGLGRYGPYVAHMPDEGKAVYRNLPSADMIRTVTLEEALGMLAAKRAARRGPKVLKELGEHPKGGEVQILDGKFGPYVKHKKTNASLPKGVEPDTVDMKAALALLDKKKRK